MKTELGLADVTEQQAADLPSCSEVVAEDSVIAAVSTGSEINIQT